MKSNKETIQKNSTPGRPVDAFDRRILGELVRNARQTYAEIGTKVGLSAPAQGWRGGLHGSALLRSADWRSLHGRCPL